MTYTKTIGMRNLIFATAGIMAFLFPFSQAEAQQKKGQQKIDPTVEVQRDFDSSIPNIHKSMLSTAINDTLSNFNINFNYSIFDKPYKDLYEFSPLPSAQIQSKVNEKLPVFAAKWGCGFPLNPYADLMLQPRLKGGSTLLLNVSGNAFIDKLNLVTINSETGKTEREKGVKTAANNAVFEAGATYGYNWNSGEMLLRLNYKTNYNTYYGFNSNEFPYAEEFPAYGLIESIKKVSYMKDNWSHRYNKIDAGFSIGSIDAKGRGAKFNYKINIKYSNTSDKLPEKGLVSEGSTDNRIQENFIKVSGEAGPTFGKYNKFIVGFNSENAIYTGLQDYNYGIFEIMPQYAFESGRLSIRAGIKLSGRYKSKDNTAKYHNTFFVNGNISYELAKNALWVYAEADGGNYMNNYSELLEQNKWVSQTTDIKAGSIPLQLKGGLRGQAYNKLSYNAYIKYTIHNGLLQYVPYKAFAATEGNDFADETVIAKISDSRLYTAYSNHREFSAGLDIKWYSKSFIAGTSLEYSNYTDGKEGTLVNGEKPYGYAPFKWHLYGTYNYRERIYIGITSNLRSATPISGIAPVYSTENTKETKIPAFCNLGLNIKYVINNSFSVFATGENLLDSHIQYYPQYLEKGRSFGIGVLVKL